MCDVWCEYLCFAAQLSLSIIRSSLIKPTLICHWLQNISQRHSQLGLFWWPHPSCLMSDVVPELHWIWFFWFLLQMIDTSSSSSSAWLMCPLLSATDYYFEGMEPAQPELSWAIQWKFSLQNSQESSKHWNALLLFDENASLWIFYQKKSFCIGPLFINHEVLWSWISLVKGLFYQWT